MLRSIISYAEPTRFFPDTHARSIVRSRGRYIFHIKTRGSRVPRAASLTEDGAQSEASRGCTACAAAPLPTAHPSPLPVAPVALQLLSKQANQ